MGVTLEMYYLGKHKARSGGYDFLRAWDGRGRQAGRGVGGFVQRAPIGQWHEVRGGGAEVKGEEHKVFPRNI